MFGSHDVCFALSHLRLANLELAVHVGELAVHVGELAVHVGELAVHVGELAVHVGVKSVVPISQPEQNDLLWSAQSVEAV